MAEETDAEKAAREAKEAKEKADKEAADKAAAEPKSFTQAELDRIVQERVARVKSDPPADYEELKAKAAKLAEIEDANKSELEKANARADKAEADKKAAEERVKETTLRSAILVEASKPDRKIVDPEAALTLLDKSKLTLDADGSPTNIAEAMDALLTAKPYLAGTTPGTKSADQGARGGNGAQQLGSTDGMSPEEIAKAVEEGRLSDYLATTT